jgi:hypothetical protein
LQFPDTYLSSIQAIESIEDPDAIRRKEKEKLIERVTNYR